MLILVWLRDFRDYEPQVDQWGQIDCKFGKYEIRPLEPRRRRQVLRRYHHRCPEKCGKNYVKSQ